MFVWGDGNFGKLGLGEEQKVLNPNPNHSPNYLGEDQKGAVVQKPMLLNGLGTCMQGCRSQIMYL